MSAFNQGDGTTTTSVAPVKVSGIDGNAVSLATGPYTGCAILNDDSVKCWGLGDAQLWPTVAGTDDKLVATEVVAVDQYQGSINKIILSLYAGFALLEDGTLHAFGSNNNDMQGLGSSASTKNTINSAEQVTFEPSTPCPTDVWQINFNSLLANFTSSSDTELIVKYDIGKNPPSDGSTTGRYKTILYEKDCTTEINTSGVEPLLFSLTDSGRITKSPEDPIYDAIDLLYDVNKTMIATSSVWNATTDEIELCQVVQLIEQSATLGEMVIQEDKRIITIEFDLTADFDFGIDLEEAALTSANGTADVGDYISAFKCDENFEQDGSPLVANDELYLCIESSSFDVEISEIETMVRTNCVSLGCLCK